VVNYWLFSLVDQFKFLSQRKEKKMRQEIFTLAQIINNISRTEPDPWYEMLGIEIEGMAGADEDEVERLEREYLTSHASDLFSVIWPDHCISQEFNSDATYQEFPRITGKAWLVWESDKPVYSFCSETREEAISAYLSENYTENESNETCYVGLKSGQFFEGGESLQDVESCLGCLHPKEPLCHASYHDFSLESEEFFEGDPSGRSVVLNCSICGLRKDSLFDAENKVICTKYDSRKPQNGS
jgi:hypothetical protein